MTQIIVSGATIINAPEDADTVETVAGVPTGNVTRSDGSRYTIGDLHNYAGPIDLHQGVSLPDSNPKARSYLAWNGSAVVTGPNYAVYQAQQQAAALAAARAALAAIIGSGVAVTSTGATALSGTYTTPFPEALGGAPSNVAAQTNITSVAASISGGHGLPGGGSTFNYYDAMGIPHAFDVTNWDNFSVAMMNYSYALQGWVLGGFQGSPPSNAVTIA